MKNHHFTPQTHVNAATLIAAGLPMYQIMEHTRRHIIVDLRTITITLLYKHSSLTQQEIAAIFKLTHPAVTKAIKRNDGYYKSDKNYRMQYNEIKNILEKALIIKT